MDVFSQLKMQFGIRKLHQEACEMQIFSIYQSLTPLLISLRLCNVKMANSLNFYVFSKTPYASFDCHFYTDWARKLGLMMIVYTSFCQYFKFQKKEIPTENTLIEFLS